MRFNLKYKLFIIIIAIAALLPVFARAAEGVPKILHYQGRLYDSSGYLLGGPTGTEYCFKFAIYDDKTVGAPDSKIWPSAVPSAMAATVKNGVFNVGIGDTSAGGDELTFNFYNNDNAYINVEIAEKVGASCTDGDETFENLNPRQRITASGYSINSDMLDGLHATTTGGISRYVPATNQFGNLLLSGESQGTRAIDSSFVINPLAAATTYSLLGLAVNSQERFKVDALGNVSASGTIYAAQDVIVSGQSVCLEDGTNCLPSGGGGGGWTDSGEDVYLTTASDRVVVGTSTSPLGKLNIYGDTNEIQLLVQANSTQTKNLTEWKDSAGDTTVWITQSGDVVASGSVYAAEFVKTKKLEIISESPAIEIYNASGTLSAWIDGNGNMGASGTVYVDGTIYAEGIKIKKPKKEKVLEWEDENGIPKGWINRDGNMGTSGTAYANGLWLEKQLKVAPNSPSNPIADAWNVYSTSDTKDILEQINPHGYLEQIVGNDTFKFKRKVKIDKEYKEALEEKLEEEWENFLESGEETSLDEKEWKEIEQAELESSGWTDLKKEELFNWKSALPKFSQSRLGVMADDPEIPPEVLAFDEEGNVVGISLSAYAGYLHVGLKEAGMRIMALEDSIKTGNNGNNSSSSAPYGDISGESLFINHSGIGDMINVKSASSTVFNIDENGNSLFGPATDSASAFLIKDAADMETLFTADTENNRIKIGDNSEAGSPTTIFVLDTKADAGDPLGEDGAMYYSANTKKIRCYEGGEWKDCISEGGIAGMAETYFTFFAVAEPVAF